MIPELWDFLTTSASKEAKKKGHLYRSIALAHRARRCQKYWLQHLQNCHRVLQQEIEEKKFGGSMAILGSGLMMETPPELFCERFDRIDLVDVVHTKDVRKRLALVPLAEKFRWIEMDFNEESLSGSYDWVVSANLLSQLPMNPKEASLTKLSQRTKDLQQRHVEQLLRLSQRHFLFSDFSLEVVSLAGKILGVHKTVHEDIPIPWRDQWIWDLAPAPEVSRYFSIRLVVGTTNELSN